MISDPKNALNENPPLALQPRETTAIGANASVTMGFLCDMFGFHLLHTYSWRIHKEKNLAMWNFQSNACLVEGLTYLLILATDLIQLTRDQCMDLDLPLSYPLLSKTCIPFLHSEHSHSKSTSIDLSLDHSDFSYQAARWWAHHIDIEEYWPGRNLDDKTEM